MSAIEWALALSVGGSVLAASAPTFFSELHASRFTEAVDGVTHIGQNAAAYAEGRELAASFPAPADLTPADIPRGRAAADPPGVWDNSTWKTLDFGFDKPHRFSFAFDVTSEPTRIWFVARAHGDLNGDGITSSFLLEGERRPGQPAVVLPELRIHREVE